MAVITVNGTRVEVPDKTPVCVRDGVLTVGEAVVQAGLSGVVEVRWEGPAAAISCDANLSVSGHVYGDARAGGNIACGAVGGSVRAGGNLSCGTVGGDVRAGGNMVCRR